MEDDKDYPAILNLTEADFKQAVVESKKTFVVQIQADWCGECFIMVALLRRLADEFAGRVFFGFVDVDVDETIAKEFGVTELPFLLLFRDGQLNDFLIGLQSRNTLRERIKNLLA